MAVKKHHHAMPVVLALAALLAMAVVVVSHSTEGQYAATRALTTRVIDVHPNANGLGQVTAHQPTYLGTGPEWAQAGSTATLALGFQ